MRTTIAIFTSLIFFACTDSSTQKYQTSEKSKKEEALNGVKDRSKVLNDQIITKQFNIDSFRTQCDSILKKLKGEKYDFEIQSDTFNFSTDNVEYFTYGHGIYWELYKSSFDLFIRHYLYAPKTQKKFRIYLAECSYKNSKTLNSKIDELKISMNRSLSTPGSRQSRKWRLSPTHDYVITGDKKLFWMNASYPYSNKEFQKYVEILKETWTMQNIKAK